MANIGFIGLGNMGGPMAANLVKAGHAVCGFDLSQTSLQAALDAGCTTAETASEAAADKDVVVTMLPAGKHVVGVYNEIRSAVAQGTLMIDSSTIDIESARIAHEIASELELRAWTRRCPAALWER